MCSRCDKTKLANCSFAEFKDDKLIKCENEVCFTCDRTFDFISSSMDIVKGRLLCPEHMTEIKAEFVQELVRLFRNDRELGEFLRQRLGNRIPNWEGKKSKDL
jgi:hypothetical protein